MLPAPQVPKNPILDHSIGRLGLSKNRTKEKLNNQIPIDKVIPTIYLDKRGIPQTARVMPAIQKKRITAIVAGFKLSMALSVDIVPEPFTGLLSIFGLALLPLWRRNLRRCSS